MYRQRHSFEDYKNVGQKARGMNVAGKWVTSQQLLKSPLSIAFPDMIDVVALFTVESSKHPVLFRVKIGVGFRHVIEHVALMRDPPAVVWHFLPTSKAGCWSRSEGLPQAYHPASNTYYTSSFLPHCVVSPPVELRCFSASCFSFVHSTESTSRCKMCPFLLLRLGLVLVKELE